MSVAPTAARRRPAQEMSDSGDPAASPATVRVDDMERALVVAREVAAATAGGGAANLRLEHLEALFANGSGAPAPERMQAALEAAGLSVEPPLAERPLAVSLRPVRGRAALAPGRRGNGTGRGRGRGAAGPAGPSAAPAATPASAAPAAPHAPEPGREGGADPPPRRSGIDAYRVAAGTGHGAGTAYSAETEPSAGTEPSAATGAGVPLAAAQHVAAAERSQQTTAASLAALLPATIVPVLAASFLGPLFGASFAGLVLVASALLSRPGALARGRMGPIRMPASVARSFLLVTFGIALGALLTSLALVAAGGRDTETVDESTPIEQQPPARPQPTTPPAPPTAAEREAAEERRERAERRRERRERARRRERRERREQQAEEQAESAPPSGGGAPPADVSP